MFGYLRKKMYRGLYSLLVYEILFANKSRLGFLSKLKKFAELKVVTNKGDFLFTFKEDRRHRLEHIHSYIIEVSTPTTVNSAILVLDEKVAVMVTIMIGKIDYELLAEVLYEKYLDQAIIFMQAHSGGKDQPKYDHSEIGFW
jgi:hypothetical protein